VQHGWRLGERIAIGRLKEVCERWLYSTCLIFALNREEQERSRFRYQYSPTNWCTAGICNSESVETGNCYFRR